MVAVIPPAHGDDNSADNAAFSSATVRISAQKGLNWLLNYKGSVDLATTLVMMRDINESYCHNPGITGFIKKRITPEMADSAFRRALDGETMYAYREDVWAQLIGGTHTPDILLTMAQYCDIRPLSKQVEKQIFDTGSATSSTRLNLFSAMIILEKLGCKSREKDEYFRAILQKTAKQVARDQDSVGDNDDSYYERIGLLDCAGYPELVKPEWVRNTVARQLVSGAWPWVARDPENPDPNATARAVWALTQYLKECPLPAKPGSH